MRLRWGGALLAIAMLSANAAAGTCLDAVWSARAGALSPGARCGQVVVTTEVNARGPSRARLDHATLAGAGDVTIRAHVRSLTADRIVIELQVPGGYLLLREGELGIYTSESQWAERGWQPFPAALAGHRLADGLAIEIVIRGAQLSLAIDGAAVGTFPLVNRPPKQVIVLGVSAPQGRRARVLVSGVELRGS